MLKYEFTDGKKVLELDNHPKSYLCARFLDIVKVPLESTSCPIHGSEARATIRVELAGSISEWHLTDFCCETYREEIEAAMPFPWTRTPHHLQP